MLSISLCYRLSFFVLLFVKCAVCILFLLLFVLTIRFFTIWNIILFLLFLSLKKSSIFIFLSPCVCSKCFSIMRGLLLFVLSNMWDLFISFRYISFYICYLFPSYCNVYVIVFTIYFSFLCKFGTWNILCTFLSLLVVYLCIIHHSRFNSTYFYYRIF